MVRIRDTGAGLQRQLFFAWLRTLLPSTLLLLLLLWIAFGYEQRQREEALLERELYRVEQTADRLRALLEVLRADLQLLTSLTLHELQGEEEEGTTRHLQEVYALFMRDSGRYFQLRLLDVDGREQVRVEERNGAPYAVPEAELQDKGLRYYMRDLQALPDGAAYHSALDLNMERGVFELPLRPTLRLAAPLTRADGQRLGVVVLNYSATQLFEVVASGGAGRLQLLNPAGYWLYHPDPALCWGFLLADRREARLDQRNAPLWQALQEASQGQLRQPDGLYTYRYIEPPHAMQPAHSGWWLVSQTPKGEFEAIHAHVRERALLLFMPMWAVLLIATRLLAVANQRRLGAEQALQRSNEDLEQRIAERTQALTQEVNERRRVEREYRNLARAVQQSPDSVVITDNNGRIQYVNPRFEQNTGYHSQEVLGETLRFLRSGLTSEAVYQELWQTITQGAVWRGELLNKRKSGELFWELVSISPVRDERGEVSHFVAIKSDISAQKALQEDLRLAASVFESSTEGIIITDAEQRILRVNRAFTQITGYSAEEAIGQTPRLLNSGSHDAEFYHNMWQALQEHGHWSGEITNRNRNGSSYPEWLNISTVRNADGELTHYIAIFSDISERKRAEQRIRHLAYYDPLTQLPNRTHLMERLRHDLAHAHRVGEHLALLFIDLDGFKTINDSLGHEQGDRLLVEVAGRLTSALREDDTVARLGGDEFVILLTGLSGKADTVAAHTISVCEKIRGLLRRPIGLAGHEALVTPSIGIALYPEDGSEVDELLKHADAAMYQAKEMGRDNYQFFAASMRSAAMERLQLESAMRHAISERQFEIFFQPQVEMEKSFIAGAEVLLRWPGANGHNIAATIAAAERSGQILALGEWVLDRALAQLAAWEGRRLLPEQWRLAVNISPRQFQQPNFVTTVEQYLNLHRVDPRRLELEVTEGLFIQNFDDIAEKLRRLKGLGVRIAIDDFGTGYSSLSYLKLLPLDALKIDQSFVRDLNIDPDDAAIVRTIVAMAKGLGLEVVAEGVEQEGHLGFLLDLGCDYYQGYLCSPAVSAEAYERLLAAKVCRRMG